VYSKIRVGKRLNVRFAPKATELLRGSEMTRCPKSGVSILSNGSAQKAGLLDHLVGAGEQGRGMSMFNALAVCRLMTSSNLVPPAGSENRPAFHL
jgi:hypothetical protein